MFASTAKCSHQGRVTHVIFYIILNPTKDDKYQRIPCESDYEVSSLLMLQCTLDI